MAALFLEPSTEPSPQATPDELLESPGPEATIAPSQGGAPSRRSAGVALGSGATGSAGSSGPLVIRPSGGERALGAVAGALVLLLVLGTVFGCVLGPRLLRWRRRKRAAYDAEVVRASVFGARGRAFSTYTETSAPFDDRDHDPSLARLPV
eukprot:IDg11034t1